MKLRFFACAMFFVLSTGTVFAVAGDGTGNINAEPVAGVNVAGDGTGNSKVAGDGTGTSAATDAIFLQNFWTFKWVWGWLGLQTNLEQEGTG